LANRVIKENTGEKEGVKNRAENRTGLGKVKKKDSLDWGSKKAK